LINTIVAGNTGNSGASADVTNTDTNGYGSNGTFTSGGYNLIGVGTGSTAFVNGTNGDQVGKSAAPLNPQVAVAGLADNGGPTSGRSSSRSAAARSAVCAASTTARPTSSTSSTTPATAIRHR